MRCCWPACWRVQGVLLRLYRAAREPDAPRRSGRLILLGWAACGRRHPGQVSGGARRGAGHPHRRWCGWDLWLRRKSANRRAGLAESTQPVRGVLLLLLLILPWLIAIAIQSHGAFLQQSLGNDFAAKLAGGQESHGGSPGYYLLLSAATFWPAILFVAPGIALGIARRDEPAIRFLLAWAGALVAGGGSGADQAAALCAAGLSGAGDPGGDVRAGSAPRCSFAGADARAGSASLQFVIGGGLADGRAVCWRRIISAAAMSIGRCWRWPACGASLALAALVLALLAQVARWRVMLSLLAMLVFVPALTAGVGPAPGPALDHASG